MYISMGLTLMYIKWSHYYISMGLSYVDWVEQLRCMVYIKLSHIRTIIDSTIYGSFLCRVGGVQRVRSLSIKLVHIKMSHIKIIRLIL